MRKGNNYSGARWTFSERQARPRRPKRTVTYDGQTYKVKSDKIEIPDLDTLPRLEALQWLCQHTYPRGYSKPNPLAGLGDAISLTVR